MCHSAQSTFVLSDARIYANFTHYISFFLSKETLNITLLIKLLIKTTNCTFNKKKYSANPNGAICSPKHI